MKNTVFPAIISIALLVSIPSHSQDRYPVTRLTTSRAQEGFPCWSPDGRMILYERIQHTDSFHLTGLWTIPAEGGAPHQLTSYIAEHPQWSPDGTRIVFDADSGNSIKMIPRQGGSPVRLVPESIRISRGGKPVWSHDGTRIAFREGSNLHVMEVKTGKTGVVLSEEGMLPLPGSWSRDDKEIYVCLRELRSPKSTIQILSLESGRRRPFLTDTTLAYRMLDISPDGTLIAYSACSGRNCDLWLVSSAGGASIRLTTFPGGDDSPSWSPDGRRLVFASSRTAMGNIYIMTLDIPEIRKELGIEKSR